VRFEKIISCEEIKDLKKVKELKDINEEIIEKAYSLFCIDFVNQLKEDYRFNFEFNKNPIDEDEKEFHPLLKFSIDLPRRKKKKDLPLQRIFVQHSQVDPFNTDIKDIKAGEK
jgi:hypothetical protein